MSNSKVVTKQPKTSLHAHLIKALGYSLRNSNQLNKIKVTLNFVSMVHHSPGRNVLFLHDREKPEHIKANISGLLEIVGSPKYT